MKFGLLAALAMIAFAANSVLNRAALTTGSADPVAFGLLRLWSGAAILIFLVRLRSAPLALRRGGVRRAVGVVALLIYMFGFSLAYLHLDAGLGALILFGCVQVTMFGGALASGEAVPPLRWVGTGFAFAGLFWLLWPGAGALVPLPAGLAMGAAGAAWGVYSMAGRGGGDPLAGTAANFVWAAGVASLLVAVAGVMPGMPVLHLDASGALLAILSGAVTSGMGYALWYCVLPHLAVSSAAAAQLSVPILAMAGGAALLSEPLTREFAIAAAVVLGGVALSLSRR